VAPWSSRLPGSSQSEQDQRLDDDVTLALRFAGGAHGTISLSWVGVAEAYLPLGRSQIVVNGSKLAIITDGIAHATAHRQQRGGRDTRG
jgi:predicted dehydrogenase